jgi:hypothetical protein
MVQVEPHEVAEPEGEAEPLAGPGALGDGERRRKRTRRKSLRKGLGQAPRSS